MLNVQGLFCLVYAAEYPTETKMAEPKKKLLTASKWLAIRQKKVFFLFIPHEGKRFPT